MADIMQKQQTMTSLEIAELVMSRHDKVRQSIERLVSRGVIALPPMGGVSNTGPGPKTIQVYNVGKRDSFVVVAQLSPEFTARLVDRWQELEEGVAQAAPFVPQTLPEALRLAADLADENERQRLLLTVVQPKAEALDRIAEANGSLCITDAAKTLRIQPRELFEWMRANRWIFKRPGSTRDRAFETIRQAGYLRHELSPPDERGWTFDQVRVTPKGMARLSAIFNQTH